MECLFSGTWFYEDFAVTITVPVSYHLRFKLIWEGENFSEVERDTAHTKHVPTVHFYSMAVCFALRKF